MKKLYILYEWGWKISFEIIQNCRFLLRGVMIFSFFMLWRSKKILSSERGAQNCCHVNLNPTIPYCWVINVQCSSGALDRGVRIPYPVREFRRIQYPVSNLCFILYPVNNFSIILYRLQYFWKTNLDFLKSLRVDFVHSLMIIKIAEVKC